MSPGVAEIPQPDADVGASLLHTDVPLNDGTAGQCAEHVGAPAAVPAVPQSSLAAALAPQPGEQDLRKHDRSHKGARPRPELAELGTSDADDSHSNITASDVASSGMPFRRGQSRTFDLGKR